MKVYLIGSLKGDKIRSVASEMRKHNLDVFDDWHAGGPDADDIWQKYEQDRGRSYTEALSGHHAQMVFDFDYKHLSESDAVVLVLPCGKSGHMEFGWSIGKGKKGYILLESDDPPRWDVMYRFADGVTDSIDELIGWLHEG